MELKEGYIKDFISGLPIKATPEEIEAVQVFSKVLVDDYGYPKERIQTRPQWSQKCRDFCCRKKSRHFRLPLSLVVPTASRRWERRVKP